MPPGPPGMMVAQPMRPPGFPAPPPLVQAQQPVPAPQEDEPPSKKQKTEDQLVPEEEWLKQHKVTREMTLHIITSFSSFEFWEEKNLLIKLQCASQSTV